MKMIVKRILTIIAVALVLSLVLLSFLPRIQADGVWAVIPSLNLPARIAGLLLFQAAIFQTAFSMLKQVAGSEKPLLVPLGFIPPFLVTLVLISWATWLNTHFFFPLPDARPGMFQRYGFVILCLFFFAVTRLIPLDEDGNKT